MITAEQARTIRSATRLLIASRIGDAFRIEQGTPAAIQTGDVILLGSDGLWGHLATKSLWSPSFRVPCRKRWKG